MDNAYNEATKRVKVKKKFYKELAMFVVMSLFLLFINVFSSPYYLWALWAIVPWGVGLLIKGIKIASSSKTSQWEQNEIRKELRAMGKNPDDYIDDQLELRELEKENLDYPPIKGYNKSDLV